MNKSLASSEYEIGENSLDSTTSTLGLSLLAILPLIASPSINAHHTPDAGQNVRWVNNFDSQYVNQSTNLVSIDDLGTADNILGSTYYRDISEEEISQLKTMQGFVSNILDNSIHQPSELYDMMYNNIESLLIGD